MPIKKGINVSAYAEWWVDCPYCGTAQRGWTEERKQECEQCGKTFIVPPEVGDPTLV